MKEESKKGTTGNKVKKLQRQYNKILVDLFDQYAAECVEEALDSNKGSFGENIQDILQKALDSLKGRVMEELGIESDFNVDSGLMLDISVGGDTDDEDSDSPQGFELEYEREDEYDTDDEIEETDEDDEDEDDEEDEEDSELEESCKKDKHISSNRRNDQVMLSEAYTKMYTK